MKMKDNNRLILAFSLAFMGLFFAAHGAAGSDFLQALEPREWSFPEDHGAHPGFRTEWWYYTGNLFSAGERPFGFQLTFFRVQLKPVPLISDSEWRANQLYFAHFTISDLEAEEFLMAEKSGRGAVGIGGVSSNGRQVRIFLHGWEAIIEEENHYLQARSDRFALDLALSSEKQPVLHGEGGVSKKGDEEGQASYYYSLTRMDTRGLLTLGGKDFEVFGASWMDHEFTSNLLSENQVGWDWMGLQLSDGRELMVYVLRQKDGTLEPASSGTLVERDGTPVHLPKKTFVIQPQGFWESPRSRGRYPSGWEVRVFPYDISLNVLPNMKDQELMTEYSTRVTYWEGSVKVTGSAAGRAITGDGYVELTGYAQDFNAAALW
jgi:predicted secreted hydrolase